MGGGRAVGVYMCWRVCVCVCVCVKERDRQRDRVKERELGGEKDRERKREYAAVTLNGKAKLFPATSLSKLRLP